MMAMMAMAQATEDGPIYTLVIGDDYEPDELADYVAAIREAYAPFAADFTMVNPNVGIAAMEGVVPRTLLLGRWSSRTAFEAYYNSPAYQAARKKREGIGRFTIFVIPDLSANLS